MGNHCCYASMDSVETMSRDLHMSAVDQALVKAGDEGRSRGIKQKYSNENTADTTQSTSVPSMALSESLRSASDFDEDLELARLRFDASSSSRNAFDHSNLSPSLPFTTSTEPLPMSSLLEAPIQGELGAIRYAASSKEEAQKLAKERGDIPIVCIEAEIPGDLESGNGVLAHPLIVEALETLFVCIAPPIARKEFEDRYKPSNDRKAWYTTVTFLNSKCEELIPPIGGDTLKLPVMVDSIVQVLSKLQKSVPAYLKLMQEEQCGRTSIGTNGLVKSNCRCIILGTNECDHAEVEFAKQEGVLATIGGTYLGKRVIRVTYNPKVLSFATLLRIATEQNLADALYYRSQDEKVAAQMETSRLVSKPQIIKLEDPSRIISHDTKRSLRRTVIGKVPLTNLQATRINLLIHQGSFHQATRLLSPRQYQITKSTSGRPLKNI